MTPFRALIPRTVGALCLLTGMAWAGPAALVMDPATPTEVRFDAREALYVRVTLEAGGGMAPCLDELEVYGPDGAANLALADGGAVATALSCIAGYGAHAITHLNDGRYGNGRSWIPATAGAEWACIELPKTARVDRVVLSRDREGRFSDRVPDRVTIEVSVDGVTWIVAGEWRVLSAERGGVAPPPVPWAPPLAGPGGAGAVRTEDDRGYANLALLPGTTCSASSVYAGGAAPMHQVAHLADGFSGNEHSWISAGEPSWAQVDLGTEHSIYRVALANDNGGWYQDRGARSYRILVSRDGEEWSEAARSDDSVLLTRREHVFEPVRGRFVRVAIETTNGSEARIDELEVYGSEEDVAPADVAAARAALEPAGALSERELLRYAFLGEEHAWLKTYGRADLDPNLVPYNGRVTEYPRHVGDDVLPLPTLSTAPTPDGDLADKAWDGASRGVARVAYPYDFDLGPLVECSVRCGRDEGHLWLAIETNRLLSSHVAVVSTGDWTSWGILALEDGALLFKTFAANGTQTGATAVEGDVSDDLSHFEAGLPLEWFPGWERAGIRVGLGMGGRHVPSHGRAVTFLPGVLSLAQVGPCARGVFPLRVTLCAGAESVQVQGLAGGDDLTLTPGESRLVSVAADPGPIGPERNLRIIAGNDLYSLHLFA